MDFIFDRNILDVTRAKELRKKAVEIGYSSFTEEEKAEWDNGLKGALNYTDLNRIEGNCGELSELLGMEITTKTGWTLQDIPTVQEFNRIRGNIELLKTSAYTPYNVPDTPEAPLNTYQKINDIEKILYDIYTTYISSREGSRKLAFMLGRREEF